MPLDIVLNDRTGEGVQSLERNMDKAANAAHKFTSAIADDEKALNSIKSTLKNLAAETGVASNQLKELSRSANFSSLEKARDSLGALKDLKQTVDSLRGGYAEATQALANFNKQYGGTGIYATKTAQKMLADLQKELNSTGKSLNKLASDTDRAMDRASARIEKFTNGTLGRLYSGLKRVVAVYLSWHGLKAVATSFLDATTAMEDYRVQLRSVSNSMEEADATFQRIKDWAAVNPVNTDEAVGAFTILKTAAVQNSEEAMKAIGDVSTAMHRDMRDVAQAVVSTRAESLRRLGIQINRTGKQATITSNGVTMTVKKDIGSIRAAILTLMSETFGGAMDKARSSWTGSMKTMQGLWTKFKTDVMGEGQESGPFATLKEQIKGIVDEWIKFTQTKDYRQLISDIQGGLVTAIKMAVEAVKSLGTVIRTAKEHSSELKGIFWAIVGIKFTGWVAGIVESIGTIGTAIETLGTKLMAFEAAHPWLFGISVGIMASAGAYKLIKGKMARLDDENMMREALGDRAPKRPTSRSGKEWTQYRNELKSLYEQYIVNPLDASDAREDERLNNLLNRNKGLGKSTGFGTIGDPDASADKKKGKSATELLVENINDQMKYLHASGEAFLPIIDKWLAKFKPLTQEWKLLKDLQLSIIADAEKMDPFSAENTLARLKETKDRMAALTEESKRKRQEEYDSYAWQYDMGLISETENIDKARENFERLRNEFIAGGQAIENYLQWTPELQKAFSDLQNAASNSLAASLEEAKRQYDNNIISVGQYKEVLNGLIAQYAEFPAVVKMLKEQLKAIDSTTLSFGDSLRAMLTNATKAFDDLGVAVTEGIVDGFAKAIAYGENLGDTLKKLGQDIIYTVSKMLIMQQVSNLFSRLFGGGSSTVYSAGNPWIEAIRGGGEGFAKGDVFEKAPGLQEYVNSVVSAPTIFPFAKGVGLMGEAGSEAIMPLARNSNGELGVKVAESTSGGASQSVVFAPNINVEVHNEGGGEMSDKQAQNIGEGVLAMVDSRFMELMSQWQRSSYFRNSYAR